MTVPTKVLPNPVELPLPPLESALMALVGLIVGLVVHAALSSGMRPGHGVGLQVPGMVAIWAMWGVRRLLRG